MSHPPPGAHSGLAQLHPPGGESEWYLPAGPPALCLIYPGAGGVGMVQSSPSVPVPPRSVSPPGYRVVLSNSAPSPPLGRPRMVPSPRGCRLARDSPGTGRGGGRAGAAPCLLPPGVSRAGACRGRAAATPGAACGGHCPPPGLFPAALRPSAPVPAPGGCGGRCGSLGNGGPPGCAPRSHLRGWASGLPLLSVGPEGLEGGVGSGEGPALLWGVAAPQGGWHCCQRGDREGRVPAAGSEPTADSTAGSLSKRLGVPGLAGSDTWAWAGAPASAFAA